MINIEVKSRLRDRRAVERRLSEMGAERQWVRRQIDTFFGVERGWMKLREEGDRAELITYVRAVDDAAARPSEYDVLPLDDAPTWKRALTRVLVPEAIVAKERTLWIYRNTRIHLDRVDGLGEFLELETVARDIDVDEARAEADGVVRRLELDASEFIAVPYRVLLGDVTGQEEAAT